MSAPVASGWSGRRVGLAPTGKAPPCHGARGKLSLHRPGKPAGLVTRGFPPVVGCRSALEPDDTVGGKSDDSLVLPEVIECWRQWPRAHLGPEWWLQATLCITPPKTFCTAGASVHEAARVHRRAQRGGGMAARRACTAARAGSPGWSLDALVRERPARSGKCDRLSAGASAFRVGRRQECPARLPLCCGRPSSLQVQCGRAGPTVAG